MSVLYAIKDLKEIAKDIDERRGCIPTERKKSVKGYTFWEDICNSLTDDNMSDELAYRLLESVDSNGEYRVNLQTVIDCINLGTIRHDIRTNSDVEKYFDALDHDTDSQFQASKEVFDPCDDMLVGDNSIARDCYRGTYGQWIEYFLEMDSWYDDYLCDFEDYRDYEWDGKKVYEAIEIPTIHEWAAEQVDKHCRSWDGDLSYKLL